MTAQAIFPAQCACGHLFLERYEWVKPQENGAIGFCWCGFCRTRRNVYQQSQLTEGEANVQSDNPALRTPD